MNTRDSHDPYVLYLLGELSCEESTALKARMDADPEAREEAESMRMMMCSLDEALASPAGADDLAKRIVCRLDKVKVRRRKAAWRWLAPLAAAACVLLGVSVWWNWAVESQVAEEDDMIVLSTAEPATNHGKPLPPYWHEANADVVALGVLRETRPRGDRRIIRMELVEILKGEAMLGPLESAEGDVPFGCIVPENADQRSNMYRQGERVAVYLTKNNGGWSTLQMTHLTEQYESQWLARVRPFLDVYLASEADDPQQRYTELLAVNSIRKQTNRSASRTGMSEAAYHALLHNPDPRAAPVVRQMLLASLDAKFGLSDFAAMQDLTLGATDGETLRDSRTVRPETRAVDTNKAPQARAVGSDKVVEAAKRLTLPDSQYQLLSLLAKMHDADSVQTVLTYLMWLPEGQLDERMRLVQLLPDLCQNADAESLQLVETHLHLYVQAYKGDKRDEYFRTLKQARSSVNRLLNE